MIYVFGLWFPFLHHTVPLMIIIIIIVTVIKPCAEYALKCDSFLCCPPSLRGYIRPIKLCHSVEAAQVLWLLYMSEALQRRQRIWLQLKNCSTTFMRFTTQTPAKTHPSCCVIIVSVCCASASGFHCLNSQRRAEMKEYLILWHSADQNVSTSSRIACEYCYLKSTQSTTGIWLWGELSTTQVSHMLLTCAPVCKGRRKHVT